MKRREFITLLGGAAAAWPLAAHAQRKLPVVGVLAGGGDRATLAPFLSGLGEAGFVEGRNVAIEFRSANNRRDRLPSLAAELVDRGVAVIVALNGTDAAVAAVAATRAIPIVFANGSDPVKLGLVSSLNHPGGNVTGVTFLINALTAKRLELLHELVPTARIVGFLVDPANANAPTELTDLEVASALNLRLVVQHVSDEAGIDAAFARFSEQRVDAFLNAADLTLNLRSEQIIALANRYKLPAIYPLRAFTAAGGLMSYVTDVSDVQRLAGAYAGRILKGEKPGDLPVQEAVKIDLVVNLKTAKALGVEVPTSILLRASEVIE